MARSFTAASSQYASVSKAVVTGVPITISAWINPTSTAVSGTGAFTIVSICRAVVLKDSFGLDLVGAGSISGSPIRASETGSSTFASANKTGITANIWHHVAGVYISESSRLAYLDGVSASDSTTAAAPNTLNLTAIGMTDDGYYVSGPTNFFDGLIADVAIWNVALTANEISALSKGVRAYFVRPKSLVFYSPLDGLASPEPDLSGQANNLTLTASPTAANGPPIDLFTPKMPSLWQLIAAGTTLTLATVSWAWNNQPITLQTATTVQLATAAWNWSKSAVILATQIALSSKVWNWISQAPSLSFLNVLSSKAWNWIGQGIVIPSGATIITLAQVTWAWVNQSIVVTGGNIVSGLLATTSNWIRRRRRS